MLFLSAVRFFSINLFTEQSYTCTVQRVSFTGENFRELLQNSFSRKKLSRIYGTVTQFATPMNVALEGQ